MTWSDMKGGLGIFKKTRYLIVENILPIDASLITPCLLPRHNHAAFASELRFSALAAAWNGKEDWKNMIIKYNKHRRPLQWEREMQARREQE